MDSALRQPRAKKLEIRTKFMAVLVRHVPEAEPARDMAFFDPAVLVGESTSPNAP
jgi:hypothetical protein